MKLSKVFLIGFLLLLMISLADAQQTLQTGSIRGMVTDTDQNPLPGVTITVTSPSLIGSISNISRDSGLFRTTALPPGTYTLVAELQGFKTFKGEGIVVQVGMTVRINITMEPSALQEEITVVGTAPTVDVVSNKITNVMSSEEIQKLPIARDLNSLVTLTAGAVPANFGQIIHGGTEISTAFDIDGINVNDPAMNRNFLEVQYDSMEEVEIMTGALPAQVGNTGGTFVNVVTKSGGNDFHGSTLFYYTKNDLTQVLFPETQLKIFGVPKPISPKDDLEASATLGGPIKKDRIWFFAAMAYNKIDQYGDFIPTTIQGKKYETYEYSSTTLQGLLKLSTQISKSIRFFTMFSINRNEQPYVLGGPYITDENTRYRPGTIQLAFTGNWNWVINPNAFLDVRASVAKLDLSIYDNNSGADKPHFQDYYTGYHWGSNSGPSEHTYRNSQQASIRITQFLDNFLWGNHEIQAGLEVQRNRQQWNYWRTDPMHWNYYNGNPYYWRGFYNLSGPHPSFGDGRLYFNTSSGKEDGNEARTAGVTLRYGAFVQDAWTIKNRFTINLGLRLDRLSGTMPAQTKRPAAGLAEAIGEALVVPEYGFNPFGELSTPEFKDILAWTNLSPRIGLSFDPFGKGKTALKAGFANYADAMPTMYYLGIHPLRVSTIGLNWWDSNNNSIPDYPGVDKYAYTAGAPVFMLPDYYNNRILPGVKAPRVNQFSLGFDHELFKDFKISVQYIESKKFNTVDTVLYDRSTGRVWNTYERAPEWWIPFTTTVPAIGEFPAQEVTLYFMSNNAPWQDQFTALANVPEAKRKYQALELTFSKRYSHGWSLGGSAVLSKTMGNNSELYGRVWGYSNAYDNANFFVNAHGRTPYDRPLMIKLYGSFDIPGEFVVSFFATYSSGKAWARSVTVVPPAAWANANNTKQYSYTVNLETPGSRRDQDTTQVDFRIGKELNFSKSGRIWLYLDIFNLLGNRYVWTQDNPGGQWRPADVNTTQGTYTSAANYGKVTSVQGTRIFKFSVRISY